MNCLASISDPVLSVFAASPGLAIFSAPDVVAPLDQAGFGGVGHGTLQSAYTGFRCLARRRIAHLDRRRTSFRGDLGPERISQLRPNITPVVGAKIAASHGASRGLLNPGAVLDRNWSLFCSPFRDSRPGNAKSFCQSSRSAVLPGQIF